MKKVPLNLRLYATVDDEDYELVSKYNWTFNNGYAKTHIKNKDVKMHRLIMGFPDMDIDHIDGDGLDNRKINLRLVTSSQNHYNARLYVSNKSGYKGVYLDGSKVNPWRAFIGVEGRRINLGHFKTFEEAKEARREAELLYHGDYARFID